ncbi:tyrosine/serine/threonine protein phosphatase pps1 [Actinomortierella ambigua]|nr:tyrosine/serine/threonine protein phosphatase pps1 [Actinomortierella ambigua]
MMVTTAIQDDGYSTLIESTPSQTSFPLPPDPVPSTPLKHISARDLKALHRAYVESPLPSGTLFPWLHGVDGHDPQQNAFFEIDSAAGGIPVPCHRGLIFVHASDLDCGRLVGSVSASEILESVSTMPPSSAAYNNMDRLQDNGSARPSTPTAEEHTAPTTDAEVTLFADAASAALSTVNMENAPAQPTTPDGEVTMASANSSADSSLFLSEDSLSFDSTSSANAQALAASLAPIAASDSPTLLLQPRFLSTETEGINIRNFKIQVARYATISNIVVYSSASKQQTMAASHINQDCSKTGADGHEQQDREEWLEHVFAVANLISEAQEAFFLRMQPFGMQQRCETMIVTEPFQGLEEQCPELIAVDSIGRPTQYNVDFWEQEREKMALLTRASEIAPGVWLGNHTDVPSACSDARSLATPVSPGPEHSSYFTTVKSFSNTASFSETGLCSVDEPSTPPNDYPPLIPPISTITTAAPQPSVCIECRAGATSPPTALLDRALSRIHSLPAPLATNDILHLGSSGSLTNCVEPNLFPPSTSSLSVNAGLFTDVEGAPRNLVPCHEEIAAMHAAQRAMAAQIAQGSESGHAILRTQISQLVEMALFVEQIVSEPPMLTQQKQEQQPSSRRRHQVLLHCVDGYTDTSLLALSYLMLHYQLSLAEAYVKLQLDLGRSFFVYPNDALMMLQVEERIWDIIIKRREAELQASIADDCEHGEGHSVPTENDHGGPGPGDLQMIKPFNLLEHDLKYGWFYHQEFEGSFPSRILPFLYLGNLAHASNPGLLETLGIRHVLSVGEVTGLGHPDDGTGLTVKLVDDMYDNGIHSLWGHLEQCVYFIEMARRNQSRVLIHCRVGVSRSATIVIAYLMAFYGLSLVDAYLTVRARRLSVIIQPNLLFMYELLQWDQRLRGRFDALGWTGIAREIHALNMYFIGG